MASLRIHPHFDHCRYLNNIVCLLLTSALLFIDTTKIPKPNLADCQMDKSCTKNQNEMRGPKLYK